MPAHLRKELGIDAPDDFYEALTALHRDLEFEESAKVNAKLVLLLANHIGDMKILMEAIAAARNRN